jgi:hypothetical protein
MALLSSTLFGQNPVKNLIDNNLDFLTGLVKKTPSIPSPAISMDQDGIYQLDSLIQGYYDYDNEEYSEITAKEVYTYDENGYPATFSFYYMEEEGFEPFSRVMFHYSESGKRESELWQFYEGDTIGWLDHIQRLYTYDNEDRLIEFEFAEADFTPGLVVKYKNTYAYDSLGLLISVKHWNPREGEWQDVSESIYSYDESGNLLKYSSWNIVGEDPMEFDRTESTYNSEGQLILELEYEFDYFLDSLVLSQKDTLLYDESGKIKSETIFNDFVEGKWLKETRTDYYYDNSDTPYSTQSFRKIDSTEWVEIVEFAIDLDEDDNIWSITVYTAPSIGEPIQPNILIEYERDMNILLEELNSGSLIWLNELIFENVEFRGNQNGKNALSRYGFYKWDEWRGKWDKEFLGGDFFFYYSPISVTSVEEEKRTVRFNVYPNPVNRLLRVETDLTDTPFDLYLYNLFGQRIFRKNISANEQIVLPDLPEGMYVLQLVKENRNLGSRRVIIRH